MFICITDSECDSSEWQAVVSNGTNLIYSWYIDSQLTAITTNHQVNECSHVYHVLQRYVFYHGNI